MMKTKEAIYIANQLWQDTIRDGSLFDALVKMAPHIAKLTEEGKQKEIDSNVKYIEREIIARWANLIMEIQNE